MTAHDVHNGPRVRTSGRGTEAGQGDPEGPPGRPHRRPRDRTSARRPAAAPRSPDRAPAPDPGQVSPDLGGASRGPCRRDEAVVCGSVRDRDLLRAFRRGEGGRARYRAADHSRLRLADLRHDGRGKAAARIAGQGRPRHSRGARALRRVLRQRARSPKSDTAMSSMRLRPRSSIPRRGARPIQSSRPMSITRPMSARAATSCLVTCARGGSARKTFSRFWTTPACAGSAAPAFPPAANGGQCWASRVRG